MNVHSTLSELRGPLCYLATPYTKYKFGIEQAWIDASKLAAALLEIGIAAYSPIAHCHSLSLHSPLDPLDHETWLPLDMEMMKRCDVLIVAQLPGWEESYGVRYEIDHFERAGKPIFDLVPDSLFMKKRNGVAA